MMRVALSPMLPISGAYQFRSDTNAYDSGAYRSGCFRNDWREGCSHD